MKNAKAVGRDSRIQKPPQKKTDAGASQEANHLDRTGCSDPEATKVMDSLMAGDEDLSANQAKELADELTALGIAAMPRRCKTQLISKMSEKEAKQYDRRAVRVQRNLRTTRKVQA